MKILSLKKDEHFKDCLIVEYKSFFKIYKRRAIKNNIGWWWCDIPLSPLAGFDDTLDAFNECEIDCKEL